MCTIFCNYRLGHIVGITRSNLSYFRHKRPLLLINSFDSNLLSENHQRSFSFQTSVESLVKTQTGLFKWLSECTLVEYSQKLILSVHDYSGLPWWASIICTTVLLRTIVTLPLTVYQYNILAKLENIKLEMPIIAEEMKKEMAVAIRLYNWDEKTAKITFNRSMRKQWTKLIERENCHPLKTTILLIFQIPLWVSVSVGLRNLVYMLPTHNLEAQISFAELSLGGFSFIPNLTVPDSSLIFPVAFGLINLAIIEFQCLSRIDQPSKISKILTNLFRGFSVLMIPIAASVPSCLVLYWTTSSAYGFIQNAVLISPKIRRICRIPKTAKELEQPYNHIIQTFNKKYNFKMISVK